MRLLSNFVLVKLEPLKNEDHKAMAESFGIKKWPAVMVLDWMAKKKLGVVGDASPEEVAAELNKVLHR